LAARLNQLDTIIITGNLSLIPLGKIVLEGFAKLYSLSFVIPDNSEFATAVGAALTS